MSVFGAVANKLWSPVSTDCQMDGLWGGKQKYVARLRYWKVKLAVETPFGANVSVVPSHARQYRIAWDDDRGFVRHSGSFGRDLDFSGRVHGAGSLSAGPASIAWNIAP